MTYPAIPESMLFDRELLEALKSECLIFWTMSWVYRSNWRVLHIDGFETNLFKLPIRTGRELMFFNYKETV